MELAEALGELGAPGSLLVGSEVAPCRYGPARELAAAECRCEVIARSKIPHKPGELVRTDRRDALRLASLRRAGELLAVTIPDECNAVVRDLDRAHVNAVRARLKARQQLKTLPLRHDHHDGGKPARTAVAARHSTKVSFPHPAPDIAFADYREAIAGH